VSGRRILGRDEIVGKDRADDQEIFAKKATVSTASYDEKGVEV
jgi:hypothetical protein